jgi:hypothetical protein
VTGLVDIETLVAWADRQILETPLPSPELIELSLSGRLPHSQIIRLLNLFQGIPDYDLPLKALLARAWRLHNGDPEKARKLWLGLRLLNAEERLPQEVRTGLVELVGFYQQFEQGLVSLEELSARLQAFLEPYAIYASLVI